MRQETHGQISTKGRIGRQWNRLRVNALVALIGAGVGAAAVVMWSEATTTVTSTNSSQSTVAAVATPGGSAPPAAYDDPYAAAEDEQWRARRAIELAAARRAQVRSEFEGAITAAREVDPHEAALIEQVMYETLSTISSSDFRVSLVPAYDDPYEAYEFEVWRDQTAAESLAQRRAEVRKDFQRAIEAARQVDPFEAAFVEQVMYETLSELGN
jgi:hypothetical protein